MYLGGSAIGLRLVLFSLGFVRLPVETAARRGDRSTKQLAGSIAEARRGDLIVANHSSWIDLLIVSYLYPGVQFLVPVTNESPTAPQQQPDAAAAGSKKRTPKKNAMSANTRIVTPNSTTSSTPSSDISVIGYTVLPLSSALRFVGSLPPSRRQLVTQIHPDIATALSQSSTPLALFPEGTTSNNRALLTFSLLPTTQPNPTHTTHLLTLKYNPPTPTSVTSVYTTPTPSNSIVKHSAKIVFLSNPVRSVAVRWTTHQHQGSSGEGWGEELAQAVSNLARLKRTSIGWSAKWEFLQMVMARSKRS
ncbi:hypothetical protein PHSY_006753 [Pseudozyma hubeiensis SY62]|uniref:Phospholipid/glycerol acyltransferase domain-containing protein n=1 Tax=Pseudozyma hubeiensis (strain SY62) TaxID=1305764 RepID=R9PCR3_PSEHS|nr:hypothetical protein PHSY_006753 [Pseudozyma hubeiensis SY62]GAC99154.1 hypothetical protein PHSY_006753 [Pseudozyma hubeiensis SY62]